MGVSEIEIKEFLCGNGNGGGNGGGYDYDYGYGYGGGYGNGIKQINHHVVYMVDGIPTVITYIKGNIAKGYILEFNVYLKPCYIIKHGRYFAHGETVRQARTALEEKIYADMDTEEAIERFAATFPKANQPYPARDFYVWHNRLTGSCEMGRTSFAATHGIDIDNDYMTVREFIELTKDSFGGQIIRMLAERMGEAV